MNDSLKPCPFCGGEPVVRDYREREDETGEREGYAAVECHCLGSNGGLFFHFDTIENAIAAWNRRAALAVEGAEAKPVAWMRRWAFDGIDVMALPKAERPKGWYLHAVTMCKAISDDIPLYTTPPAGIREALIQLESIIHELAGDVRPGGPEDRAWAIINKARTALRGQS